MTNAHVFKWHRPAAAIERITGATALTQENFFGRRPVRAVEITIGADAREATSCSAGMGEEPGKVCRLKSMAGSIDEGRWADPLRFV